MSQDEILKAMPPEFQAGQKIPNPVQYYAMQFALIAQDLDKVLTLHQPLDTGLCKEDGKDYPCPTALLVGQKGDAPAGDVPQGDDHAAADLPEPSTNRWGYEPEYWDQLPDEAKDRIRSGEFN